MIESLVLIALIVVSLVMFLLPVMKRIRIVRSAKGSLGIDQAGRRTGRWISEVIFQKKVISQKPFAGIMHALVFWGFLVFVLATVDHFCRGFGVSILGEGAFFRGYSVVASAFAALVIIGITSLFIRRFVFRPSALGEHLSWESGLVALFIEGLMITYILEVASLSEASGAAWINWWIHSLFILGFLVVIPRSKHLHLLFGLFATFFKDFKLAPLEPLDIENEEFGAEKLNDLGWFAALGAFSCVECGRCQEHCPAFASGKELNPKAFVQDLKSGFLENAEGTIAGSCVTEEVLWQCTTCGACTFQCPVGVEHVSSIINTRRGLVAEGSFPSPLKTLFKSLERHKNPWGYSSSDAEEFLRENGYPKYEGQEVLYWLGCFARYDESYRKVSLAFRDKLIEAGISWGVLYNEACTGDAARRAGNEFLFMELAMENIALLNDHQPGTIVFTCPHCMKTIDEYRSMEEPLKGEVRLIHHSTMLKELFDSGKLKKIDSLPGNVVYHDACYLSRYAGRGSEEPREYLKCRGASLLEPGRKGSGSFCCGAGGAQFFNEEDKGERIYRLRTDELLETNCKTFVTACPFCQSMLRDGLGDRGAEDVSVKDIAQV